MKLYFPKTMYYNGRVFKAGETYELEEERPGFIQRWLKRGCTIVEEKVEVKDEIENTIPEKQEKSRRKPTKRSKKRVSK